jgi:hypothetical protein
MQFSITALVLALAAVAVAAPQDPSSLAARQNQNRPVPSGNCCVANTNLKQDACKAANGQAGRCVPGGNSCEFLERKDREPPDFTKLTQMTGGSALSCVAQSGLTCDAAVIERGKSLCRANFPGGGFFDGANKIQSLSQAKVN